MGKNVTVPLELLYKITDLCAALDEHFDCLQENYPESPVISPEVEILRKEVWNMLIDKADKIESRQQFLKSGGKFKV